MSRPRTRDEHPGRRQRWLWSAVAGTRKRATRAHQLVTAADVACLTFADAAHLIRVCQLARAELGQVEDALASRMAATDDGRARHAVEVDGVGAVEVVRGRDRKAWDHDGLLRAVLDRRLADAEGEIPDPFTFARDWLLSAAHVSYWRVTPLKALGIDPDDYSTSSPGRLSVRIQTSTRPEVDA